MLLQSKDPETEEVKTLCPGCYNVDCLNILATIETEREPATEESTFSVDIQYGYCAVCKKIFLTRTIDENVEVLFQLTDESAVLPPIFRIHSCTFLNQLSEVISG